MPEPGLLISSEWWEAKRDELGGSVRACLKRMSEELNARNSGDEYHAELYCGQNGASGIRGRSRKGYTYSPATLPYNVVRSAVDTLVAKIAKHRPLPQVLAHRGDWTAQKKARKMTQLLDGEFYKHKIFEQLGKIIVRDAAIFGRGAIRVDQDGDRLCVERVHPWELYTDPFDDRYGSPMGQAHVRWMDKGKLLKNVAAWNDGKVPRGAKEAIRKAGRITVENGEAISSSAADEGNLLQTRCEVAEMWHLCTRHDDDDEDHECDGRHVIYIDNFILVDEVWAHDFFPIIRLNYADPVTGYDGMGLAEILEGYQFEINQMSEKVAEAHHLMGMSLITLPDNLGIPDAHIVNGVGTLLRHRPGGKPEVFTPPPVHPQTYQRLRDLPRDAIADSGISLLSATSQKPAGVESGVALQALDDVETERFIVFGRAYEAFCLDIARTMLKWIRCIADEYGDYAVKVPMKSGVLELSWKDIAIDGYYLKVFATSLLPQQLPQRLERLKFLYVDVGLIDKATFLRNLDSPDLQAETDMAIADKMLTDEMLEAMRDADEEKVSRKEAYFPPTPTLDLMWSGKRANQTLCTMQLGGAPEFNMNLVRDFRDACEQLELLRQRGDVLLSGKDLSAQRMEMGLSGPGPDAGLTPPGMAGAPEPPIPPGGGAPMPPEAMPSQAAA